jgi:hypothetical protein
MKGGKARSLMINIPEHMQRCSGPRTPSPKGDKSIHASTELIEVVAMLARGR